MDDVAAAKGAESERDGAEAEQNDVDDASGTVDGERARVINFKAGRKPFVVIVDDDVDDWFSSLADHGDKEWQDGYRCSQHHFDPPTTPPTEFVLLVLRVLQDVAHVIRLDVGRAILYRRDRRARRVGGVAGLWSAVTASEAVGATRTTRSSAVRRRAVRRVDRLWRFISSVEGMWEIFLVRVVAAAAVVSTRSG